MKKFFVFMVTAEGGSGTVCPVRMIEARTLPEAWRKLKALLDADWPLCSSITFLGTCGERKKSSEAD